MAYWGMHGIGNSVTFMPTTYIIRDKIELKNY